MIEQKGDINMTFSCKLSSVENRIASYRTQSEKRLEQQQADIKFLENKFNGDKVNYYQSLDQFEERVRINTKMELDRMLTVLLRD